MHCALLPSSPIWMPPWEPAIFTLALVRAMLLRTCSKPRSVKMAKLLA